MLQYCGAFSLSPLAAAAADSPLRRPVAAQRPHTCRVDGCTRVFYRQSSLRRHLRSHTAEPTVRNEVAHVCHVEGCGRSFTRMEHLKRHMRSYTGERPFRWCGPGPVFSWPRTAAPPA
jgi:uncharacterized Zn-finger protein